MLYSGTYMAAVGVKGLTLFGDRAQGRAGYTQHYRPVCCSIVRGSIFRKSFSLPALGLWLWLE